MAKPRLTRQQFVDEVNRILPEQVGWQEGMRVFLVPVGTTGRAAHGIDFEGEEPAIRGVTAAAQAKVLEQYDVEGF